MSEAATDKPITDKPTDVVEEVEKKPEVNEEAAADVEVATAPLLPVKPEGAGDAAAEKETPVEAVEAIAEKTEAKGENEDASQDSEKAGGDNILQKELDDEAPKTFPQVVSDVVCVAWEPSRWGCDVKELSPKSVGCLLGSNVDPLGLLRCDSLSMSCLFLSDNGRFEHSHFLSDVPKTANGDLVE
jgi:hypothetical protein